MHIVETLVNGSLDKESVKTFVKPGTDYQSGWGLPMHANKVILSEKTEMVDVFEVGDRVTCEVHRGSVQNEDGICTGGEWVTKTGVVTKIYAETDGFIEFDDFDHQAMSLIRGDRGYPGRNIQTST